MPTRPVPIDTRELVSALDAWLPQTQCTRCGYPRCRAYAEALADGRADLNRCPPGGETTLAALARLLDRPVLALDPACGAHGPRVRAVIDEVVCVGCRKCLDVCPVDAIVGARKLMHTVIEAECSGCGLCVPPCPVDCIALVPGPGGQARSASGSPQSKPDRVTARTVRSPLPPGAGMGVRDDRPHPLPSPEGRGGASLRLPVDRDESEGAPEDSPWPEYSRTETSRWRWRTERRLARLAGRKPARPSRSGTARFPDRATLRAGLNAALERVRARRRRDEPA